ncbi:hypothetical protein [Caproiciproducens faecalis]|uniref:DUF2190 family protein n=1 Tax=Caproiciproducens faecalis TaxID=2820301 RepID=A0ABS7DPH7_9FIRM|nr:hypothetical protein [Caproiciproducens faecalis]MBW7572720.1 hypothetical protein [Caproiciproducens faecalis]
MNISLNGYGEQMATFEAEAGVTPGMPVKMTGNGKVGAGTALDAFCGVAVSVRGGFAAVQLSGYVTVPYSGTAPTVGYQKLNCAADGKVQTESTGRSLLVTDVDTAAQTCGIIL